MTNFCVEKFSEEQPYTALTLIVHVCFRKINFHSCHRLRKYSYNKNFQIYSRKRGALVGFCSSRIRIFLHVNILKVKSACLVKIPIATCDEHCVHMITSIKKCASK